MRLYDDQLIVVTGGAGFIGSCCVKQMNDLGMTNIVVVDELGKTEKWKNLVGKRVLDVVPKNDFFNWLEGRESDIEAFIHLGACSSTVETDASYLLDNNYRFSVKLAEYALHHSHKLVYASSAATYGDGSQGFSDNDSKIDSLRPLNMYGLSKQLFDQWVKNQGVLGDVTGLKFFNVFGPNEYHKGRMASAVFHMYNKIKQDGFVELFASSEPEKYKDGEQVRDFIYVKDAVNMILAFLSNDNGGIYNVGSGVANTWNHLATSLFQALGRKVDIRYKPMPEDLVGKYQNYTCADMAKTKKAIQAKSHCRPLNEAVADYVNHYLVPEQTW